MRCGRARSSVPMTIRSGRMKSSIAAPSRRNSGLEATSKRPAGSGLARIRSTSSAGADRDGRLGDTRAPPASASASPISRGGAVDVVRSAWPSPRRDGVPTAMKTASAPVTAVFRSVVNDSRPAAALLATSWSSPGSKIGISPREGARSCSASMSTQVTDTPKSEKQAPETRPTYPSRSSQCAWARSPLVVIVNAAQNGLSRALFPPRPARRAAATARMEEKAGDPPLFRPLDHSIR